jgi:hypothetical protein
MKNLCTTRSYALKMNLLAISLLMWSVVANSQICSGVIKIAKDESRQFLAGSTSEGYFVAVENERTQSVELRFFNYGSFEVKSSTVVSLPEGNKDQKFEQLLFLGNGFIMFTGGFSKESDLYQIMATLLDAEGNRVADPSLVHYTVHQSSSRPLVFKAVASPDASKIVMVFDSKYEQKKDMPLSLKVYDRTIDLLWEKELTLPYQSDILEVHNYAVDNTGDVFLMSGRNPMKDAVGIKTVQMGKHAVFYYNAAENKLKEFGVGLRDKQVVSAIFKVHPSGDLMITGYYSNDAEFAAAGTFLFTISAGGSAVKAASMMPFSKDFLLKFMREKQVENRPTLVDYYLDQMLFTNDGQILLVGEQYYITETVNSDPISGNRQSELRYHFDNVIATLLQADGRQLWSSKISKTQYVLNDPEYCSYALFANESGWQFFFNDSKENATKLVALPDGEATSWSGGTRSQVTCVELDTKGALTRSVWVDNEEDGLLLLPGWSGAETGGRVILSRSKGKSIKYCEKK